MSRSSDLDKVAPDDMSVNSTPTENHLHIPAEPEPQSVAPPTDPFVSKANTNSSKDAFRDKVHTILGHTHSPLSSFLINPKVFSFEERDDDESIILVLRPHWFTNVGWILTTIIMLFVPTLLQIVPLLAFFPARFQFAAVAFWYLITFLFAFEKFLGWYFDVFIVTDERVIDIDFNNLLDKKFSEAGINMIQDVSSKVVGLSQTIFNYGNVLIQTAAEIPELRFEKVPNPEKIIKILQELRQQAEQEALAGRIK